MSYTMLYRRNLIANATGHEIFVEETPDLVCLNITRKRASHKARTVLKQVVDVARAEGRL